MTLRPAFLLSLVLSAGAWGVCWGQTQPRLPAASAAARPAPSQVGTEVVPEDINGDLAVDATDLAAFIAALREWLGTGVLEPKADFNSDGRLDRQDARRLLHLFVSCAPEGGRYWKAVATGRIGPEGGAVSLGGLTVTVPPGAFAQATTLTLYPAGPASPLDPYRVSPAYSIGGLPETVAQPLALRMELDEPPSPDAPPSLVWESQSYAVSLGADVLAPMVIETTVDGQALVGTVPPYSAADTAAVRASQGGWTPPPPKVTGAVWQEEWSAGKRFRIQWLSTLGNYRPQALSLAEALNTASTDLQSLGIVWSGRSLPIEVVITPFTGADEDVDGLLVRPWGGIWGIDSLHIQLNSNRLTMDRIFYMKVAAAHELVHLVYSMNHPSALFRQGNDEWYWLEEALCTWFEQRFGDGLQGGYIPGTVRPNPQQPSDSSDNYAFLFKRGLHQPDAGTGDHGYGASMFLTWLSSNRVAPRAIMDVLRARATAAGPVEALAQGTGLDLPQAWRDFCRDYVLGAIYPGTVFPDTGEVLGAARDTYTFDSFGDRGTFWTWFAPDLGARLYKVFLQVDGWHVGTKIRISLADEGGGANAFVYKVKGTGRPQPIGAPIASGQELDVPSADQLATERQAILVMVANGRAVPPYAGDTPVSLKVELIPPPAKGTWEYSSSDDYYGTYTVTDTGAWELKEPGRELLTSDWRTVLIEAPKGIPNQLVLSKVAERYEPMSRRKDTLGGGWVQLEVTAGPSLIPIEDVQGRITRLRDFPLTVTQTPDGAVIDFEFTRLDYRDFKVLVEFTRTIHKTVQYPDGTSGSSEYDETAAAYIRVQSAE